MGREFVAEPGGVGGLNGRSGSLVTGVSGLHRHLNLVSEPAPSPFDCLAAGRARESTRAFEDERGQSFIKLWGAPGGSVGSCNTGRSLHGLGSTLWDDVCAW